MFSVSNFLYKNRRRLISISTSCPEEDSTYIFASNFSIVDRFSKFFFHDRLSSEFLGKRQ